MRLKICLFFVTAIGLGSCVDIPDFDNTPQIEIVGAQQDTRVEIIDGREQKYEMVTLTISFTDGDGDLGITNNERQDSLFRQKYSVVPNWGIEGNYELTILQLNDDGKTWEEVFIGLDRSKWLPLLKSDGKPGPIKGKLDLDIRQYYSASAKLRKRKYKVRIIDRNFHISNWTKESNEVSVPVF
jgi:hypothetical protein